jgi:hypothetical protein
MNDAMEHFAEPEHALGVARGKPGARSGSSSPHYSPLVAPADYVHAVVSPPFTRRQLEAIQPGDRAHGADRRDEVEQRVREVMATTAI